MWNNGTMSAIVRITMKTLIPVLTIATITGLSAQSANLSFESDLADWTGIGKYEVVAAALDRQSIAGEKKAVVSASTALGAVDVKTQEKSEKDSYLEKWNALNTTLEPKSISAISQVIAVVSNSKVQVDVNAYRMAGGMGYGGVSLINSTTGDRFFYSVGQVETSAGYRSSAGWDYEIGWHTATFNVGPGDWELTAGLFGYGDDLPVGISIDNIRISDDKDIIQVDEPKKGGAVIGAAALIGLFALQRYERNRRTAQ